VSKNADDLVSNDKQQGDGRDCRQKSQYTSAFFPAISSFPFLGHPAVSTTRTSQTLVCVEPVLMSAPSGSKKW
jgi:hypothetical protein